MTIGVVGVNHHVAPISIRESVSFTDSKKIEAINYFLDQGFFEVVILSTCNRSEIYIHCDDEEKGIELTKKFYRDFFGVPDIESYLFSKVDGEAIDHLLNVSAGLDSIVLGEDQILGQVKDAHEFAMNMGSSKKVFNKLFRQAIETAKEIKNKTKISEQPLSISYIAIKFLKEKVGSFQDKKILVIGTGNMGRLALTYLVDEGAEMIYLASRNFDKSNAFKEEYPHISSIKYEERYQILKEVDIVLSATAAPHFIIKNENLPEIEKELIMMDIALPRDIDPKINEQANVQLYDIDILKGIRHENENKRRELSEIAQEIIKDSTNDFLQWLALARIDPTIKSLNDRCLEIKEDSMDYLFRKLELTCKEKQLIDWVMASALKRLMREPIVNLKQIKDEGKREDYVKAIEELFNI